MRIAGLSEYMLIDPVDLSHKDSENMSRRTKRYLVLLIPKAIARNGDS